MIIKKVLNNNVVITLDENQREQIVMGLGIAFKKKCGDLVPDEKVEKVFKLSDKDNYNHLQKLMEEIPLEHIELSDNIILYAKTHLGKKLNENIYISLTDHISTALGRHKEGVSVKNVLLHEIRRFYQDEFCIGMKALEMIYEKTGLHLPEDEAGFIAFHIVNAERDDDTGSIFEITKVMKEITNIVKYHFNIVFDEESVYYYRFITHLKFFSQRLISGNGYHDEGTDDLLDVIKSKYKNAFDCVGNIKQFLEEKYQYSISNEEQIYLTIHIARVTYKNS